MVLCQPYLFLRQNYPVKISHINLKLLSIATLPDSYFHRITLLLLFFLIFYGISLLVSNSFLQVNVDDFLSLNGFLPPVGMTDCLWGNDIGEGGGTAAAFSYISLKP